MQRGLSVKDGRGNWEVFQIPGLKSYAGPAYLLHVLPIIIQINV